MIGINKLMQGARNAVVQCMGVKEGEKVLIITDGNIPQEIPQALQEAAGEVRGIVETKVILPPKRDGEEPSEEIATLMKKPDVLFIVTSRSLTHTKARREASKAGVRIASMPHITRFSFETGGLTADYFEVKKFCEIMKKHVQSAFHIRVTSENGTDLELQMGNHKWDMDNGIFHNSGDCGNLPAGEVSTTPNEGSANGTLVFDKMDIYGDDIRVIVRNGFAERIENSEKLKREIDDLGKKARNIAEIGIGCNPKAKVIGNALEDEKVFGTIHIALGNNQTYGGSVDVPFHVDGIILKPTLIADGRVLIKDGKWMALEDTTKKPKAKIEEVTYTEYPPEEKVKEENQVVKQSPYGPYIPIKENLEGAYFPRNVLGFARIATGEGVVRSGLYGIYRSIVKLHERLHLMYNQASESAVRGMTNYLKGYGGYMIGCYS